MDGMTHERAEGYLAAMIDGEGNVDHGVRGDGSPRRGVRITNTDPDIIAAVSDACALLGIPHRVQGPYQPSGERKPSWTVAIVRLDALAKVACLPIMAERKATALRHSLATARRRPMPSRGTLERLYVFEDRSSADIARVYSVRPQTVVKWVHRYELPIRSRSDATALGRRNRVTS